MVTFLLKIWLRFFSGNFFFVDTFSEWLLFESGLKVVFKVVTFLKWLLVFEGFVSFIKWIPFLDGYVFWVVTFFESYSFWLVTFCECIGCRNVTMYKKLKEFYKKIYQTQKKSTLFYIENTHLSKLYMVLVWWRWRR